MATTWPRDFSASTMRVLCCGETRQQTSTCSTFFASSSSDICSSSAPVSTSPPGVSRPMSRAIACAVSR
jgi:hypothetical protein